MCTQGYAREFTVRSFAVWIPPSMWQFTRVKYYLVLRRTEPNVNQRRNASHTQRAKIAKPYFIKSLYSVLLSVTWRAQHSLASLKLLLATLSVPSACRRCEIFLPQVTLVLGAGVEPATFSLLCEATVV